MATLGDLAAQTQDRLGEVRDGIGIFWNLQNEILPALVEGMNEASLITGDPEVRPTIAVTLNPGGIGGGFPPFVYAMPANALMLVRIDATNGGAIKKVLACDLDRNNPGWEGQTGPLINRWFPIGMKMFGVWPALTAAQQVLMTFVGFPETFPYNTSQVSPFREEFNDAFPAYAAHICRLKESTVEFQQSLAEFQSFQDKMMSLTKFAARRGITRFTQTGRVSKINDVVMK
jgi:hypothetical protein